MIAVAVVTFVMGRQLGEMRHGAAAGPTPGAAPASASVVGSVKQIENKVVTDTAKAADQSAARLDAADK